MAVELEEPFATVDDLKVWWPDMPPGSESYAGKLLLAASQFIVNINRHEVPDVAAITLEQVTCEIVRRSMQGPDHMLGMEQVQQSAGPFQFSHRPINPHGDFYLTKQEKRNLGIGGQRAFEIDLLAGSRKAHEDHDADRLP